MSPFHNIFALAFVVALLSLATSVRSQLACSSGETIVAGQCQSTADDACSFDTVPQLETINPPRLLDGQVAGVGSLAIEVHHALTAGRRVTAIALSSSTPECNYPGVHWTKAVGNSSDDCVDTYSADIPWSVAYVEGAADQAAAACGLERSEDADYVIFYGRADVDFEEQLQPLRGMQQTRLTRSTLQFRLRFPKTASISTNVTVFDDPRVVGAVTAQQWQSDNARTDFQLTTSLQWPFKLTKIYSLASPDGVQVALASAAPIADCADVAGDAPCSQTWQAYLTPNASTCTLDGAYPYEFDIACRDDVPPEQCPLADAPARVPITATLASENICAVAEEDVGVELALTSHQSFSPSPWSFGAVKSAFLQSQTMHFNLRCASTDAFNLETTTIEQVVVTDVDGNDVDVFNLAAGGAADGWNFATLFNAGSDPLLHEHQFEFVPTESAFGQVAVDQSKASVVTVVMSIVFENTGLRKRFTLRTRQQQTADGDALEPVFSQTSAAFDLQPAPVADDNGDDNKETVYGSVDIDFDTQDSAAAGVASGVASALVVAAALASTSAFRLI